MKRIAVFIDHDIIIRHFLLNGVLQSLEKNFEVFYIFPDGHKRVQSDLESLGLKNIFKIKVNEERAYLLRRLYHHEALRNARRSKFNKKMIYEFWREALGRRAFLKTWAFSFNPFYFFYRRHILKKIPPNETLDVILESIKPNIIVHPTVLEGLFVTDVITWGAKNKVPTVYLMNSWDNPSTKAMISESPTYLIVWGEQTKKHAIEHLQIPEERILAFGAAQFDIYKDEPELSYEDYREKLNLTKDVKVVLYAGSSKGINEVAHLKLLEEAIEKSELPPCKVIFRPHPWRGIIVGELDFFGINWNHVIMDPEMVDYYHQSRINTNTILKSDIRYTHSILNACDVLISPISTIMLEAAMHGKPIIPYLPMEDINTNFFLRTMVNMKFMEEFFIKLDCAPVTNIEELKLITREYLLKGNVSSAIKNKTNYFVNTQNNGYKEELNHLLLSI